MIDICPKYDFKIRRTRRQHYRRLQKKRQHYYLGIDNKRFLGIVANTPAVCSCLGCGNQRKYDGPTRQEIKANELETYYDIRNHESI